MDVDSRQELAEASALLETAKGPKVRQALSDLVASLQTAVPTGSEEADISRETTPTAATITTPTTAVTSAAIAAATAAECGGDGGDGVPAAVSGSHLPEAGAVAAAAAAAAAAELDPPSVSAAVVPGGSRTKVEGGVPATPRAPERKYATVEKFAWDQGSYNSPKVSVYVPLEGVGAAKERVSCSFTTRGFDLTVIDLNGKSYRLLQDNLDKDIVPEESKILVKKDKVIVKLQKVKGEFGSYDSWNNLAAKKARKVDVKSNPQAGIMDMMKDMYEDGDDATKKLIGEAMMKSQQARGSAPGSAFDKPDGGSGSSRGKSSSSFDGGLGGLGNLGGLGAGLGGLGGGLGGLGGAAGGLDSPAGNFDSMMDDLNLDMDKDPGDGGWGAAGKDDFGFGSAVPPPQASEPVPAAAEEEEDDDDVVDGAAMAEQKEAGEDNGVSSASAPSAKLPVAEEEEGAAAATAAAAGVAASLENMEALDD